MAILALKDVTLQLGGMHILNGLSVEFWEGHVHALIAPNEAGKSTLTSTIMGLPRNTHYSGRIAPDGEPLDDMPLDERARRGTTLAWQEPVRFEGLRMDRFIAAAARAKSIADARDLLARVGPADSLQHIVMKVDVEPHSFASVQAHCTLPNAVDITHTKDAVVEGQRGGPHEHFERHRGSSAPAAAWSRPSRSPPRA